MKVIYESKDITPDIEVVQAWIFDSAGGIADRAELHLSDVSDLWSIWKPQKGHSLELKSGVFSSGEMRVDQIRQELGSVVIEAVSLKPEAMTKRTRSWEMVRFKQVAADLAGAAGLNLERLDIDDWLYDRIDQNDVEPLVLLSHLCMREGYRLKLAGDSAYIYDERKFEQMPPAATIYRYDLHHFEYLDRSVEIFGGCELNYYGGGTPVRYSYSVPSASVDGILKVNERVTSSGEAERFAKGYLRAVNKFERTAKTVTRLLPSVAGGSTVELLGTGLSAGKFFVEMAVHELVGEVTELQVRGLLEGY